MKEYTNAIEINRITKRYDGFLLDNISFNVPKGTIMGFIGQNGAGKTTTINSILNIIKPDSGTINVLGLDTRKDELTIKQEIAAVFDELPFHETLNAKNLNIILRSIFKNWNSNTFFDYLDRFSLPKNKQFGKFSKGMKMKLQIATALSHNAKILIMDEATTGLDPITRNEFLDLFMEFLQDEDHSILMSSHITSDIEKIADGVTFINKGRLLLSDNKDTILNTHCICQCSKADFKAFDPNDYISARVNEFGVSILFSDRSVAETKYSGVIIDNTSLEEILMFYVNSAKKEWR